MPSFAEPARRLTSESRSSGRPPSAPPRFASEIPGALGAEGPVARAERLGHRFESLGRASRESGPAAPAPRRLALSAPTAGPAPIQAFSLDRLREGLRATKSYLNPKNYLSRRPRAASHYGEATNDIADEVDRSLNVVSPARLLLGKFSSRYPNKPNDVTRSDRDEINRLIQNAHAEGQGYKNPQGRAYKVPPTGLHIQGTRFLPRRQAETRAGTTSDLIRIAQTRSGRELLRGIEKSGRGKWDRGVSIDPKLQGRVNDPNDGFTEPQSVDQLSKNQPTGSRIHYIPSANRDVSRHRPDPNNPWIDPSRGDIALYHELVHSHHQQRGGTADTYRDPLPRISQAEERHPVDRNELREEYRTVGLSARHSGDRFNENRYRQERRELGEDVPKRTTYNEIKGEKEEGEKEKEEEDSDRERSHGSDEESFLLGGEDW